MMPAQFTIQAWENPEYRPFGGGRVVFAESKVSSIPVCKVEPNNLGEKTVCAFLQKHFNPKDWDGLARKYIIITCGDRYRCFFYIAARKCFYISSIARRRPHPIGAGWWWESIKNGFQVSTKAKTNRKRKNWRDEVMTRYPLTQQEQQ